MHIRNFLHKGLKRLHEEGNSKGVPPAATEKLYDMLYALERMKSPEQLRTLTAWKVHTLVGDRKGVWSMYVTRNVRLSFRVDADEPAVIDLNLEDYH